MFISSTMSLGARVSLLLVPLVTALDPAAAHATQSGDFTGLVDVGGGRKMYLECRGSGSPTVVLVAGLRGVRRGLEYRREARAEGVSRGRQVHQSLCL